MQTEIDKLLHADDLNKLFGDVLELNPEHVVMAWYDAKECRTKTIYFGAYPAAIGLAHLLNDMILEGWPDAEEDGA